MIKLLPHQVCPFSKYCGYSQDGFGKCNGTSADRPIVFICELWAENYNIKENSNV